MLRARGEALSAAARGRRSGADTPQTSPAQPSGADAARGRGGGADPGPDRADGADARRGPVSGGRVRALLIVLGYVAAALVVTWRLWADPASHAVAGNPNDADLFAWYLRYAATAVAHGRLPALVTTAQNAPQGISMMWNSSLLLPGVLLAPVTLLLGPQVSLTVLTTVGFAGSAAALFWVLRRWGVSDSAAALAGAVYGFSPALLHAAIGHYNLQLAILPPLIVDAGLCVALGRDARPDGPASRPALARRRAAAWDGARLGILASAQLFISEELLLTAAVGGLLLLAGLAIGPRRVSRRQLGYAALGTLVAAVVCLLLSGWALLTQFAGPLTQHGSPFLADFFENDLSGFVTPSGLQMFHTAASAAAAGRFQGGPSEYLAYLGWPLIIALVLSVVVFWRQPVIRAMALTCAVLTVLSLGGHLLLSGTEHAGADLPWRVLESLPLIGSALPDRISIAADGFAAALLACSVDLARSRLAAAGSGRRAAAATAVTAAAVLVCLPLLPLQLPSVRTTPVPAGWNAVFRALRLPPGAPVLVVPVPTAVLTVTMRWQAETGYPGTLIGGYFIGPAWNGQAYIDGDGVRGTAAYLDRLWIKAVPADSQTAGSGLPPLGAAPTPSEVRADLAAWQPAAVVAVTPGPALTRYLVRIFGEPDIRSRGVMAWRRSAS